MKNYFPRLPNSQFTIPLMTFLTARENVRMSLELHDDFLNQDINAKAIAILETVGLADRVDYYPEKLSGGQKQRVALA